MAEHLPSMPEALVQSQEKESSANVGYGERHTVSQPASSPRRYSVLWTRRSIQVPRVLEEPFSHCLSALRAGLRCVPSTFAGWAVDPKVPSSLKAPAVWGGELLSGPQWSLFCSLWDLQPWPTYFLALCVLLCGCLHLFLLLFLSSDGVHVPSKCTF